MIIITGASFQYYYSLRQFLNTIQYKTRAHDKVYVVDLGLLVNQKKFLLSRTYNKNLNIEYLDVGNLHEYPAHCKNLGSYAFKAMILNEFIIKPNIRDTVCWMDSANIVHGSLLELEILIYNKQIYSPYSSEDIKRYCHPTTITNLNYTGSLNRDMLSGNLICLDCKKDLPLQFLKDFIKNCLDPNVIIPQGSSRINHRQDQSVLTILYWNYYFKYNLVREREWKHVGFHDNLWLYENMDLNPVTT